MKTPPFKLYRPDSISEAVSIASKLISENKEFDWIAGGTDLLPNYKWHINSKNQVISLGNISEMTRHETHFIGAMVSLHDLENGPCHSLIRKAASTIASTLIRRSGTLGGNLCLDTRCFWFNQTEEWRRSIDWCHKCDCDTNADCRVIPNQNTLCVATYQGDLAPCLMVLGASIHLAGPNGERTMKLHDFYALDGMKRNVLEQGEFVTHITIPKESDLLEGDYQKLRLRESWDFPEAGVAASWRKNGSGIQELHIATTACESIPRLHSTETEDAISEWNGQESAKILAEKIRKSVKPVNNTYFPPAYRRKMLRVLTKRALSGIWS
jgi:4-hydroxybenzoyl-CoA reductase subunit beta